MMDAMMETKLFVLTLREVSDSLNLATSVSKVYSGKGRMKGGQVILMGYC